VPPIREYNLRDGIEHELMEFVLPQQPLALCGSQDGTARLVQVQGKRVLATFPHEASTATSNAGDQATGNSVEWYVPLLGIRTGLYSMELLTLRSSNVCS
jgi:hypothetical protein